MELIINEIYYSNMYSAILGPIDSVIQAICKDKTYSESYEIAALSNIFGCALRSVYPQLDVRDDMAIVNDIFMPLPPVVANGEIRILWSHTVHENEARALNNSAWSPNHFVPLLLPPSQSSSINHYRASSALVVSLCRLLPRMKTTQIRLDA